MIGISSYNENEREHMVKGAIVKNEEIPDEVKLGARHSLSRTLSFLINKEV